MESSPCHSIPLLVIIPISWSNMDENSKAIATVLTNTKELELSHSAVDKLSRVLPLALIDLPSDKFYNLINNIMENERVMTLRVPVLKGAENARTPLAIHLACQTLHIPPPRDDLIRIAGVKKKEYLQALLQCTTRMGIENQNTIKVFGIKYSRPDIADDAHYLLNAYKEETNRKYHLSSSYTSALYQGAAFFVAAKIKKDKTITSRDTFFETLDLPDKNSFAKTCAAMETISQNNPLPTRSPAHFSDTSAQASSSSAAYEGNDFHHTTSISLKDSHSQIKTEILQSVPQIQYQDLQNQSVHIDKERFLQKSATIIMPKQKQHSNVQFDNMKSVQMREAAELEAAEKKRKSLEIYSSWKRAVLHKHNLA